MEMCTKVFRKLVPSHTLFKQLLVL